MLTVFYSCEGCGLVERPVLVPERETEDVVAWMNQTTELVSTDHQTIAPQCRATKLKQLKIPLPKAQGGGIGQR